MLPFVADATEVMEAWQSWFNAPDLKSDEGASPPGVRIPTSPPIKRSRPLWMAFFIVAKCWI